MFRQLQIAVADSYRPFGMKDEDPEIFVGFQHEVGLTETGRQGITFRAAVRSTLERRESEVPKFIHARSNVSRAQIRGIMKGAIMRCVDCAESPRQCAYSILMTYLEFRNVGHTYSCFNAAMCDLSRRYLFLKQSVRLVTALSTFCSTG